MRNVFDTQVIKENDALLTTGEAARLLGVSRQHIVDLCERGDIQYSLVGTHRRIRASEIDALMSQSRRAGREQLRSLWLNIAAAGILAESPDRVLAMARANLRNQLVHKRTSVWSGQWISLLDGPIEDIFDALTSRSPRSTELRQNSPFSGVLSERQRREVLAAFDESHPGGGQFETN